MPKVDPAEIDKIGRVFAAIRRQPADRKAAAAVGFTFRGEEYLAQREPCISTGPHVRGAVCFSGSKPSVSRYFVLGWPCYFSFGWAHVESLSFLPE